MNFEYASYAKAFVKIDEQKPDPTLPKGGSVNEQQIIKRLKRGVASNHSVICSRLQLIIERLKNEL